MSFTHTFEQLLYNHQCNQPPSFALCNVLVNLHCQEIYKHTTVNMTHVIKFVICFNHLNIFFQLFLFLLTFFPSSLDFFHYFLGICNCSFTRGWSAPPPWLLLLLLLLPWLQSRCWKLPLLSLRWAICLVFWVKVFVSV